MSFISLHQNHKSWIVFSNILFHVVYSLCCLVDSNYGFGGIIPLMVFVEYIQSSSIYTAWFRLLQASGCTFDVNQCLTWWFGCQIFNSSFVCWQAMSCTHIMRLISYWNQYTSSEYFDSMKISNVFRILLNWAKTPFSRLTVL